MRYFEDQHRGVIVGLLTHGDFLLESIRQVARAADCPDGIVLSGIGSLSQARLHVVATNDYPPRDLFLDLPGPLEIINYGGVIANYEPHLHIGLLDGQRRYYGGHLEDGCRILTLSEFSILRLPGLRLTRRPNEAGIGLLELLEAKEAGA